MLLLIFSQFILLHNSQENVGVITPKATIKILPRFAFGDAKILLSGQNFSFVFSFSRNCRTEI